MKYETVLWIIKLSSLLSIYSYNKVYSNCALDKIKHCSFNTGWNVASLISTN
jgi:uncharacterized membrane protein